MMGLDSSMTSVVEDLLRSAKTWESIMDSHVRIENQLAALSESVHITISQTLEGLQESMTPSFDAIGLMANQLSVSTVTAELAGSLEDVGKLTGASARDALRTLDNFTPVLPEILKHYEAFTSSVSASLDISEAMSHLTLIELPAVSFAQEQLEGLRLAAWAALPDVSTVLHPPLRSLLDGLEEADSLFRQEQSSPGEEQQSVNPILLVAVLTLIVEFLANQREVLETAFTDVSIAGNALLQVWPYAVALVAVMVARAKMTKK
jgi:hypothetical protein